MTNEDAIKELKILKEDYWVDDGYGHETKQYNDTMFALEMAIKALSQQPCDDAISRQAALDAFGLSEKTRKYGGDHSGYNTVMLYEIQDVIEDLPSVSTEKTGRWEFVQYGSNPNIGNWHCSECNRIVCGAITAASPVYSYKYCPNCGAKMVETQESEVSDEI